MRRKLIKKGQGGFQFGNQMSNSLLSNLGTSQAWHSNQQNTALTLNALPQTNNMQVALGSQFNSGLNNMVQQSMPLKDVRTTGQQFKGWMKNQGDQMKAGQGSTLGGIGGAVAGIYDVVPTADKVHNSKDQTSASIRGGANKALLSGAAGPWGMLAGAINMGIDKTGGFTDASQGLGKGTDTANMIASLAIPGAGWFTKKTENYKMSDTLKQSSGYTGTTATGQTAQQNAGAKILFGKGRANNMIKEQKRRDNMVQGIMSNAQDDFAASNNPLAYNNLQMSRTGGYQSAAIGRKGMKIFSEKSLQEARNILNGIQKFQEGGKMNVIPEGALHAHKHNMELEDITKKGIPVVTEKADGGLMQQAEIERNEIIFNLEVTKKLEELLKDNTDESAVKAGKLLVREILHNTEDNTGLIDEVE